MPTTLQGRILEDVARNVDAETVRQPVGVCAAIVPFNFPAMVPFWFLPFAIACGNAFVLKPSEQVPLTQQLAFEALDSLGLPPGVVNLRERGGARWWRASSTTPASTRSPSWARPRWPGSSTSAPPQAGKRVQALGGAKNQMVVMPDAVIERTVDGIVGSAFGAAGPALHGGLGGGHGRPRRTTSCSPPLREATEALRVGDGSDEDTDVGPVISLGGARSHPRGWIERGVEEGVTPLAVDGRGKRAGPWGRLLPRARRSSTASSPRWTCAREEVFGPVLLDHPGGQASTRRSRW